MAANSGVLERAFNSSGFGRGMKLRMEDSGIDLGVLKRAIR